MLTILVRRCIAAAAAALVTGCATVARAQTSQPATHDHAQMQSDAAATPWHVMHDGVVYAELNHQGGPRGGTEFVAPNWWMGMAGRRVRSSELTFTAMLSLDAATVGKSGYGEIFQVGEALDGHPLVDRQHPHDLFMQLAAIWKTPVTPMTSLTFAAAPVGEPALGPIAFMHRPSAAENPFAALGHHTFDSTHIAFGVVTAAVDRGRWTFEGSLFNGREPDEDRWDFDFGRLDSASARVWFRPAVNWELQVSSGHLTNPEELEPGNVQRTTASAAWFRRDGENFAAITTGYGVNAAHETHRQSVFVEGTRRSGLNAIFGRAELVDVETAKLLDADHHSGADSALTNTVGAFTAGAVRDVLRLRGFEGGVGASVSFYAVPDVFKATHGRHPVSFQLFFRLRPPASAAGRMWNMRMSRPMAGDGTQQMHHHGG